LALSVEQLLHPGLDVGALNKNETPRLHEADGRPVMRRFQQPPQHSLRQGIGSKAPDVTSGMNRPVNGGPLGLLKIDGKHLPKSFVRTGLLACASLLRSPSHQNWQWLIEPRSALTVPGCAPDSHRLPYSPLLAAAPGPSSPRNILAHPTSEEARSRRGKRGIDVTFALAICALGQGKWRPSPYPLDRTSKQAKQCYRRFSCSNGSIAVSKGR